MEDNEKIIIEFIKLSKNREKVFRALEGETLKPTDISKKTGIHRNRLLNPENKRGRLYELSEYGKKILDLMKS